MTLIEECVFIASLTAATVLAIFAVLLAPSMLVQVRERRHDTRTRQLLITYRNNFPNDGGAG